MSKLSFRARHLDPSKQMPIYLAEELPDLPEYSAINRAVPQMPSGMEKEEESEHHLQRAICTGLIIPTPEVLQTDQPFYDAYYPPDYKMPRQMIHMQPLGLDTEVPDYDMDSADMEWLGQQPRLQLTELRFEQMMDRLEKSSGQTVVTLNEARTLLNQDDETNISVYDYWLNKRLKMQHPLILTVKTESRPGASSNNPYLAFRRRTEKMQTRKNRKNDEASYEKMLKLRRDLQRATTILEMVRRREDAKREHLKTTVEIFEKRVEMRDFNGAVYSELNAQYKSSRPVYNSLYANQYSQGATASGQTGTAALLAAGGVLPPGVLAAGGVGNTSVYAQASQYLNTSSMTIDGISAGSGNGSSSRKEKRPYRKRKHKLPREKQQQQQQPHQQQQHPQHQQQQQQQQYLPGLGLATSASGVSPAHLSHLHHLHRQSASPAAIESNVDTEEEDYLGGGAQNGNKLGSESEEEAPFAFRRKVSCNYLRMRGDRAGRWPWESPDENEEQEDELPPGAAGLGPDPKYRYTLTSINYPRPRCIGFARRRLGRGGRVLLDRATSRFDDLWSQFDYTVLESVVKTGKPLKCNGQQQLLLSKPSSPPTVVDLPTSKAATADGNAISEPVVKVEPSCEKEQQQPLAPEKEADNDDDDVDDGDEAEYDLWSEDENISRLGAYSSAVTLQHNSQEVRLKRRRLRRKKQQLREQNAVKRLKSAAAIESEEGGMATDEGAAAPPLRPLPRSYLHRLSLALQATTQTGEKSKEQQQQQLQSQPQQPELELKQEMSCDELVEQSRHANHQQHHHRSNNSNSNNNNNNSTVFNNNNNNNTNSSNNNNNSNSSSSNMNKNVSISEKFNVIKVEEADANASANVNPNANAVTTTTIADDDDGSTPDEQPVASTSAAAAAARAAEAAAAATTTITTAVAAPGTGVTLEEVAKTIKRELIEADDSNEPLSSIQRTAATASASSMQNPPELMDDDEAEDDVNLAQLSSIIRHTAVKKELQAQQQQQQRRQQQEEKLDQTRCFNQMPDVIRLHNKQLHIDAIGAGSASPAVTDDDYDAYDYMGGLSPTSSQRLDICNELLLEIRRDWLHFRPKTPTDELSDCNLEVEETTKLCGDGALVDWTQDTPISIELSRLGKCVDDLDDGVVTSTSDVPPQFMSSAFKYTDLDADAQLLQTAYALDYARGSSNRSPDNANGNCSDSGSALGSSGSGAGSALEFNLSGGDSLNDINNLLGDDHMLVNILQECSMDDPKALNQATSFWNGILDGEAAVDEVENADNLLDCKPNNANELKRSSRSRAHLRGTSTPLGSSSFTVAERPATFFSQTPPVKEEPTQTLPIIVAAPPEVKMEMVETPMAMMATTTTATTTTTARLATPPPVNVAAALPVVAVAAPVAVPPVAATPIAVAVTVAALQPVAASTPLIATQPQLLSIPAQITTQQQQQQQQQHQQQQLQQLPQKPQQVQVSQQLLNQFATIAAPNTTQLIARTEFVSSGAAVGDIVTITPHTGSSPLPTLPTLTPQQQQLQHQLAQAQLRNVTVQQRQATPQQQQQSQQQQQQQQPQQQLLFQMPRELGGSPAVISSQSIVTTRSGNHMIYTTSSGEIMTAAGQVSGQKVTYAIQKSGSGGSTSLGPNTVITLSNVKLQNDDSNSQTTTPSSVNIINTASGQQLAVHSISGLQQQQQQQQQQQLQQQQQTTTSTPLILTTSARNNVWRQVSGTNTAVATTAVLSSTTSDSATAVGNKILWAGRATQKRQLNGPENTDINKLLLNRKFSQRKVGQQAVAQQQIQLTKQQLQQLVLHEDELVATGGSEQLTLQDGGDGLQQQQQHQQQQQQQLQKFSKVIKMAQFPLLVSDLNLQQQAGQQQQQQQQKPNSAAAIAANHNYSLQPATAIITSQAAPQQANKIFLTSSNSSGGGGGNFTIATASELQAAVAASNAAGQQKLHYKELPNSNLKLNFVSSAGAVSTAEAQLVSQASQQLGATTVVLNKTGTSLPTTLQQQQQQQQQQHQKLKTSSGQTVQVPVSAGDKRVLYTSLLNVKPLQKNNSGQMQMQLGPAGLQQVLRGRLNNSAILTRTLPLGTTVNSTGGGGGGGTPTTIRQLVTSNANNVSAGEVTTTGPKEVSKAQLTVEQVIASANNGGVVLPTSNSNNNNNSSNSNNNNNNNNNNANSSNNNSGTTAGIGGNGAGIGGGGGGNGGGGGGGGGVTATTSQVNATPAINR